MKVDLFLYESETDVPLSDEDMALLLEEHKGLELKFDENQPRDDHGRWTDGGGTQEFDSEAWRQLPMGEARAAWHALSHEDQDTLADPEHSAEKRVDEIVSNVDWPTQGDMRLDISARVAQFQGDLITSESGMKIEEYAKDSYTKMLAAGAAPEAARDLTVRLTDYLIVQEFEATGRTLGDHGAHHISEDMRVATDILRAGGLSSAQTEAIISVAAAFHDAGYLTPPARVFLDETHARWGAINYQSNIAPTVIAAFGQDFSNEVASLIYAHDDVAIDWVGQPAQSAMSTADNMALFHYEKMPALLRYVPANTGVLVALARGKIDVPAAQIAMRANIDASHLSPAIKGQMREASREVSGVLPKYTLGMVGTTLDRVSWKDDHPLLHMHRGAANEALSKVVDFGQKQFHKFADTYGADPQKFVTEGRMVVERGGKTLLEVEVELLRKALELKYSDDQPRDEDGRWTDGGGTATDHLTSGNPPITAIQHDIPRNAATEEQVNAAKAGIVAAGGTMMFATELPSNVIAALPLVEASPPLESHVHAMNGIADALGELKAEYPAYAQILSDVKTRFCLVGYEPSAAAMTAATGPHGATLLINTAHDPVERLGKGESWSTGSFLADALLASGAPMSEAVRAEYRASMYHEVCHVVDRATGGGLTQMFGSLAVDVAVPFGKPRGRNPGLKVSKWIEKNFGGYAATSPKEGAAEAFTKVMLRQPMPKGMEMFSDKVKQLGKSKS